jgi:hypothetical protein
MIEYYNKSEIQKFGDNSSNHQPQKIEKQGLMTLPFSFQKLFPVRGLVIDTHFGTVNVPL